MTKIPLATAPEKPRFGETCNGCGFCCAAEVCEVGQAIHGSHQPAPCPSMTFKEGRFWCGAIEMADEMGPMQGFLIRLKMGIGVGCDADDPDPTEARA